MCNRRKGFAAFTLKYFMEFLLWLVYNKNESDDVITLSESDRMSDMKYQR